MCIKFPGRVSIRSVRRASVLLAALLVGMAGCNGSRETAQRGETEMMPYGPYPKATWNAASNPSLQVPLPVVEGAEFVNDDQVCMTCHETYVKTFQHNVHRGQACEKCHGAASKHVISRGREPGSILSFKTLSPPQRSEICLTCHQQDACSPGTEWRTSQHAHHGVSCTNCHTSHYNVPPGTPATSLAQVSESTRLQLVNHLQDTPSEDQETLRAQAHKLGAVTPQVCYRCHANKAQQQEFAHAHQICGATGFDCTTCHDPHGKIRAETRVDLCLQCHNNHTPDMAWFSGAHSRYGVACTDCHNPHPDSHVQSVVNIQHTNIRRPKRLPMSVDEPYVCYKCHTQIYAKNAMPSHHPIKEGKMVCSDCHDPHGQGWYNLKETTVNQVCYRCHAEKQGPFAYEHPPVTENCTICHEPHGAVANNLLRQPATFLCLRCHTGHRTSPVGPNHDPLLGDVGTNPALQRAFYSDCTQCHSQIHGSDVPSPHASKAWVR